MSRSLLCLGVVLTVGAAGFAGDIAQPAERSAERGRDAVRGRPALNPPVCAAEVLDNIWKRWGLADKPADFARALRERYGLHEAPYDNGVLPMGLHQAPGLFGKGISTDCLMCHAGSVAGRTIIGMGNSTMDIDGLLGDLLAGIPRPGVARMSYVRGTIDPVSPAAFLMSLRDAELNLGRPVPFDTFKDVCSRPPAWWQLKKKQTRDWTGAVDARAARLDMINLLSPFNSGPFVRKQEGVFADIHAFVLSVEPPKYPFPIDGKRAERGQALFAENCARCHGTYGATWTYPNKIVPLDKLGTDPLLAETFSEQNMKHYNNSWFARELSADGKPYLISDTRGYQAPPLDGIWATAPYFHNASAPTVYHVLNSKARPKVFTRSYETREEDYDPVNLGCKVTALQKPPSGELSDYERHKIYDTSLPGRGNGGHPFGDELSDDERYAVIEYLKTL